MDGFTVATAAMRDAATAAQTVAQGLRAAGLAESVTGIGAALPGGVAQQGADQLTATWTIAVRGAADAIDGYATRVAAAATEYDQMEQAVGATLGG